ncbi:Osmosensitive K+ channel histidine kinase KdpD [Desulfovibrio sp. TomC]|nr:Osmosensitive K+ channel histidine kinase KdpD [Desulfovibrio sp. TomC]
MSMDADHRPDPDRLLEYVNREENKKRGGRLRIFLGMAPGVGKTYSMLETARLKQAEGVDVLVGVAETHGRAETEALLTGLAILPRQRIDYRGHTLSEFDLDQALSRHPELLLVDELAHTNAPGCRHDKRWKDVVELLDNGVDVWSTLNVQHLESLGDIVAQITGVRVRETVPDTLLERAESVVLVDLPPDDLRQRLKEGKVYLPQQADWASTNFFRQGNLMALRELALRATAQRANTEVLVYRHGRSIQTTWPTSERILVCVGPSPSSAKLVRAAKRLASELHAPWLAVSIQTALPQKARDSALRHLKLAEELGAETFVIQGVSVAREIVAFARQQNVTKIIVGKPVRRRFRDLITGSPVDQLIRESAEIDVHVIRGETGEAAVAPVAKRPPLALPWRQYLAAGGILGACTGISFAMFPFLDLANLIMVYMLGVMAVAIWLRRGPAVAASVLSVVTFDFFFVPPRYSFAVSDVRHLITFVVMFLVALVMSSMAGKLKRQAETAGQAGRQSVALAALARELVATRGLDSLLTVAQRHLVDVFRVRVVFLLPDDAGGLLVRAKTPGTPALHGKQLGMAQWVLANGQPAGWGTQTLADSDTVFLPLKGAGGVVGVVTLEAGAAETKNQMQLPDQQRLLEAFLAQIAQALEVDRLEDAAKATLVEMESEKLKSSLLSSVTHDFQTPLAAIAGSAETIMLLGKSAEFDVLFGLAQNIYNESARLSRLVDNLLRLARLESGKFKPNLQAVPLEEVLGAALNRLEPSLASRPVTVDLAPDLPLAVVDEVLMEQLFVNLLENAVKHTPAGTAVSVSAKVREAQLLIQVADQGQGLPPEELERIFDRFYRVNRGSGADGYGLGLAICRLIAKVHGGDITARNVSGGGLRFDLTLPLRTGFNEA